MAKDFWDTKQRPIMVAHRGGDAAGVGKENTLAAFEAAAKLDYEYGETDVLLTKDGYVMAGHGADNIFSGLLHGHQSRRLLQGMTLEEISKEFPVGGEASSTLEQLLLSQPKMRFFVDPKTEEVVEPLYELLKRLDAFGRVCVNSTSYRRMERFKKLADKQSVWLGVVVSWPPTVSNKNLSLLKRDRLDGIDIIHLHYSLASREMIDLLHSRGLKALIWTCNTEATIQKALASGADGIISDRVALLNDILEQAEPTVTKSTK